MAPAHLLGLVVTVLVLAGVAVAVLVFEKSRAEQIEDDLRDPGRRGRDRPGRHQDDA